MYIILGYAPQITVIASIVIFWFLFLRDVDFKKKRTLYSGNNSKSANNSQYAKDLNSLSAKKQNEKNAKELRNKTYTQETQKRYYELLDKKIKESIVPGKRKVEVSLARNNHLSILNHKNIGVNSLHALLELTNKFCQDKGLNYKIKKIIEDQVYVSPEGQASKCGEDINYNLIINF